jgi:hypothetical protein
LETIVNTSHQQTEAARMRNAASDAAHPRMVAASSTSHVHGESKWLSEFGSLSSARAGVCIALVGLSDSLLK